jgi:hypothetical protein
MYDVVPVRPKHMHNEPDVLLREADLANIAPHVSKYTWRSFRYHGGGPKFVKIGRSVYYSQKAFLEWLASNTFSNTSEVTVRRESQ